MNKTKFLTVIIVLLIATNLVLIFTIALPNRHHPNEPKKIIIDKLGLDNSQQEKYQLLIQEHQQQLKTLDKTILVQKSALFMSLKNENQTAFQDSIINALSLTQKEVENLHIAHFKAIKSLCKPNQTERFNSLTEDLAELFSRKRKP